MNLYKKFTNIFSPKCKKENIAKALKEKVELLGMFDEVNVITEMGRSCGDNLCVRGTINGKVYATGHPFTGTKDNSEFILLALPRAMERAAIEESKLS